MSVATDSLSPEGLSPAEQERVSTLRSVPISSMSVAEYEEYVRLLCLGAGRLLELTEGDFK